MTRKRSDGSRLKGEPKITTEDEPSTSVPERKDFLRDLETVFPPRREGHQRERRRTPRDVL